LAGHVARIRARRNSNRTLLGRQGKKRLLEGSICRWVGNIEMNIRERIGWYGQC
jgi:hypothetical protein